MKRTMQGVADPDALRILKPLFDISTAYTDTSHLNEAEREKFNKALFDLGQAVREILKLFREPPPRISKATIKAVAQIGLPESPLRAAISSVKEDKLIAQIRLACLATSITALLHPVAGKRILGSEQTVKAQKARSTKSDAGRKLVYERLDQLFSESPDWRNKKPEAIAKHIHPDIDKKVREMPEKERPQLKGRSTVSKYVKEYRRRVK